MGDLCERRIMTDIQQHQQCDGPHRPTSLTLRLMLGKIPAHIEIQAISVNGQSGFVTIETYHEGLMQAQEFNTPEYYEEEVKGES